MVSALGGVTEIIALGSFNSVTQLALTCYIQVGMGLVMCDETNTDYLYSHSQRVHLPVWPSLVLLNQVKVTKNHFINVASG